MRKSNILAVAVASLLASSAFADSTHECQGNSCNTTTAPAGSSSSNSNSSAVGVGIGVGYASTETKVSNSNKTDVNSNNVNLNSNVAKGGAGGKGGESTAVAVSEGGKGGKGGSASAKTGDNTIQIDGDRTVVEDRLQAPALGVANVYATTSCFKGGSLTVSGPGFGVGGGAGKVDAGCEIRETARSFASIGEDAMAYRLLCASPIVQQYIGTEICLQSRQPKAAPAVDLSKYATKAELDRAFKAGLKK